MKPLMADWVMESDIPPEIWRYYLMSGLSDKSIPFSWKHVIHKVNNEILTEIGKFTFRCLKLINTHFKASIPVYQGNLESEDECFISEIHGQFKLYLKRMEEMNLKDALSLAMEVSSLSN